MKRSARKILLVGCASAAAFCCGGAFLNGANIAANASVSENVAQGFRIEETAAIRKVSPNGIRFTTNVDAQTKATAASLTADGYTITYGALLCPTHLVTTELTFEALADEYECDIVTQKWQNDEQTQYTSVLAGKKNGDSYDNFLSQLYNTPISARGYMKAVKGTDTMYYYTENTAERSLAYVAAMAAAEGDASDLVTSIAENVSFEMEAMTLTTDTSEGVVLYNALSHSQSAPIKLGGVATTSLSGVTYSVGDHSVVSVSDDGTVTALKVGTTMITATYNGKAATADVTVNDELQLKSDYSILYAANATDYEIKAANTLKRAFEKAGVTVPIVSESGTETTQGKYISVGATTLAANNLTLTVEKDTASQVATTNNTVFIKGKTDNGTLYGVQQWLGDVLGYDYFMKDTYTVTAQTIALPTATEYVPDIEHNVIDQNRDVRSEYGIHGYADGVLQVKGNIHNSVLILPYATYGSSHSKWYARKGKYSWSGTYTTELCYKAQGNTTEYNAMVEQVATTLATELKNNPTYTRASFAVSDGYYICKCSACQNAGNTSDTFVPFLNDVCAAVQTKLSNEGDVRADTFKIVTLAYHQTNAAPTKITSLDSYSAFKNHVELWFGDSYGDYTEGLKDSTSTKNQEIYTNFQNWINLLGGADAAADTLLWVYYTNTQNGFVPYNTFDAIRENYALAKENGIDYVFNQTIQAKSGWTMLKHYLISQLAWNATPDDDTWNGWIDTYFQNAYGAGAADMRAWFNDWRDDDHSAYNTSDSNPAIHKDMTNTNNFPKETMEAWIAYAEQAVNAIDASNATAAEKALYKKNVLLEKLSPEYFLIKLYDKAKTYGDEFLSGIGENVWNITNLGEQVSMDATKEEFETAMLADALKVTTPATSSYYEFTGKSYVESGKEYTFSVKATESRFDNLIVYVNNEAVALNNGSYTVTNVTSELTIKVVHPYIEHGANASVEYGSDSIKITDAVYTNTADQNYLNVAYISADYVNYMMDNGYTTISLYMQPDGVVSDLSGVKQDGGESRTHNADNGTEIATFALTRELPIYFWVQKDGSGANIKNKGGYMTVTDLKFVKADNTSESLMPVKASVTKSTSSYYTIDGDNAAELGENYAFTVTPLVGGCDDFIVFVNDNEVTPNSEDVYVVENVQSALTIKVLHGYIEHESNVTITYNEDGSIKFEKILANSSSNSNGWISADYINYMIGKGYKYLGLTVQLSDIEKVNQGCVQLNGNWVVLATTADSVSVLKELTTANTDLKFWLQKDGNGWRVEDGGYMTITGLTFAKEAVAVTAPTASDYYTFSGATAVGKGGDYTFTVKSTDESKFKGFLVYVNDTLWTGNNGTYTVENVDTALTIKVVHGYIEHDMDNVMVTYNGDGSIIVKGAVWSTPTRGAWISADYINYMISQGYKSITMTAQVDGTYAKRIVASYNGANFLYDADGNEITAEQLLGESCTVNLYMWVQDANGSGGNATIQNNGYMTITELRFVKEKLTVTAPAASDYYTFSGATSVETGSDYTFTVKSTDESKFKGFLVYVNDTLWTGENGSYTVENVDTALTIKVVHGYIEHGANVKVTYNNDGSIKIEHAVFSGYNNAGNLPYAAWVSADYINYMIDQGYETITITGQVDGVYAKQIVANYNGTLFWFDATGGVATKEKTLENCTADMYIWAQNSSGTGNTDDMKQYSYITISGLKFSKAKLAVTAPATSNYYTFNGASGVEAGDDYTFTLTATNANCNEFIVLVDGEEVTPVGGKYTVKNVTSAPTIKVLHGYIECDTANGVTVTYNSDGTIIVKGAVWSGTARSAWISADYINYMISQGYKVVSMTAQVDGTYARRIVVNYNGSNFLYDADGNEATGEKALGETCSANLYMWVQDANGSGGNATIQNNGYMTISNLIFAKETVAVTAPAKNEYYTFNGATSVAKGGTYTFSLTATYENCNDFIVFVNDEEVTPVGGKYTVKNVQSALTIKVLHGYIEHGAKVTVTYNDDGSIKLMHAAFANSIGTVNEPYGAWISAEYVNYMISKGYTKVQLYMTPDGTVADNAHVMIGTNGIGHTAEQENVIATLDLLDDSPIYFWVQKGDSGNAIKDDNNSYMTITELYFE